MPLKRDNPSKLGFDLYSGNFNGAISNYYNYSRVKNGEVDTVLTYATTQSVNDAIDWMDTMNKSKPFFLWLAFNAPHDPFHIPPSNLCDTSNLNGADINTNPEKYFKGALQALDTELGRLLNYLDDEKMLDSTHIIFVSDNGNPGQVAQNLDRTKAKGTIYDYGIRVPMIVAGPAVSSRNSTSETLLSTVDIFASIAELAGFANWKNHIPSTTVVDSRSFVPILMQKTNAVRSVVFSETFNSPSTQKDGKTIRNQHYHLLRFDSGAEEFYNQTLDPFEANNLLNNMQIMTETDFDNYHSLCDSLSEITNFIACSFSSTNKLNYVNLFTVYPNPCADKIIVESKNALDLKGQVVKIANIYGQIIDEKVLFDSDTEFDLSLYPSGVYILQFLNGQNTKIIKQ